MSTTDVAWYEAPPGMRAYAFLSFLAEDIRTRAALAHPERLRALARPLTRFERVAGRAIALWALARILGAR